MMTANHPGTPPRDDVARAELLAHVAEALDRVRYGVVQLTVHDGRVMQVDVTERRRFG